MLRNPEARPAATVPNAAAASRLLNADRLKFLMAKEGLDAVVATAPENVTYASGYWAMSQWLRRGPQTYVLVAGDNLAASTIIASTTLLDLVADQDIWIDRIRRFGYFQVDRIDGPLNAVDRHQAELYGLSDDKDPLDALCVAIREAGLERARIGLDELGLLHGYWERLQEKLPQATFVPALQLFRAVRAVKTAQEIERLRQAAHMTERSIEAALAVAREGASECDLAEAFHSRTVAEGGYPVLGCIGFGTRSAMPNVQPSDAKLKRGEVIRFDVGGRYQHYRADIARIAVLGEPDRKVTAYYRALHIGTQKAIEMIRPGVRTADVFDVAVEAVRREGIPHYSRSHVGHGIGIDGYDPPDLAASSAAVIEEGMVLCVETPYYELGWCGLQVEDMVVVRADGCESLMSTDGRLMTAG